MTEITQFPKDIIFQPVYAIDLSCKGYKGEKISFKVEILTYAIDYIIQAAQDARCVYELFAVRRVGDIWKYLWLRPVVLPQKIKDSYLHYRSEADQPFTSVHAGPVNQIPFLIFDDWFYWNYDTDPEEEAWLNHRDGEKFKLFAEACFEYIKQSQIALRSSRDLLIQSTIKLLDAGQHKDDYTPKTPFTQIGADQKPFKFHRYSENYYNKLVELLATPEINSVAYRDGNDFQTMRLCCTEQIRRVSLLGESIGDFTISAIGNMDIDEETWGAKIAYYDEGLAFGDIFIQQENDYGNPIKFLFEIGRWKGSSFIFSIKDEGDLPGYRREINQDWVLYRLTKTH